eukprot:tig00020939_g16063.t1
MGMTEDGQQLTPEQVNAFLDNSKTGGIERMACLPAQVVRREHRQVRRHVAIMQHNKSEDVLAGKEDPVDPRFFVLLDDVISDARLRYDEALNELFVAGRHYKIMTLITTQYAKGINPVLRSNTDLAVIFKCSQAMQREALAKEWGTSYPQRAFYYLLDKYTQDNHCLIIDSSNNSTNPLDVLTSTRPRSRPRSAIGSKEYWEGETVNGKISWVRTTARWTRRSSA